MDCFEIYFRKTNDAALYKAKVEITYRSSNVIRFTVKAGNKELMLEKLLYKKTYSWKIINSNVDLTINVKANAKLIMDIQNAIDQQLKSDK